jgi:hypothetical protein
MKHPDFKIGAEFWCGWRQWRCTDVGTRTIVAIRLDKVEIGSKKSELRRRLSRTEAEAEGWFNGPPYAAVPVTAPRPSGRIASSAMPDGSLAASLMI